MRVRSLSLFLSMLCLLTFTVSPAWCDENKERYIKVLGVDSENLHLEVDGRNMDIPLPDGYEPALQVNYPELFDNFFKRSRRDGSIPLCILIESEEKKAEEHDHPNRIVLLEIYRRYIPLRFTNETFFQEFSYLKSIYKEAELRSNEERKNDNIPTIKSYYIYEDYNGLSILSAEDVLYDNKYRDSWTISEILVGEIVIYIQFYENAYDDDDIRHIERTTLAYIQKLGKK